MGISSFAYLTYRVPKLLSYSEVPKLLAQGQKIKRRAKP